MQSGWKTILELSKKLIIQDKTKYKAIANKVSGRSATKCMQIQYSHYKSKKILISITEEQANVSDLRPKLESNRFYSCHKKYKIKRNLEVLEKKEINPNIKIKKGKWSDEEQILLFKAFSNNQQIFVKKVLNLNRNLDSIRNFINSAMKTLKESKIFPYFLAISIRNQNQSDLSNNKIK